MPDLQRERDELAGLGPGAVVIGLDEVGRGALAGPVCVGALALTAGHLAASLRPDGSRRTPDGLDDSKALTAARREQLVAPVAAWASGSAVGAAAPAEIDAHGIVGALRLAALRALADLAGRGLRADVALLDGAHDWLSAPTVTTADGGPARPRRVVTVVKGDRACATIAGASVLAKVSRDATMTTLSGDHPDFAWERNKGYGSAAHRSALERLGPCDHHRRSWRLPERIVAEADPALPPPPLPDHSETNRRRTP